MKLRLLWILSTSVSAWYVCVFFQISNGATIKVFKKKAITRSGNKGSGTYLNFCAELLGTELWQIVSWWKGSWRNWYFDTVEPNEEPWLWASGRHSGPKRRKEGKGRGRRTHSPQQMIAQRHRLIGRKAGQGSPGDTKRGNVALCPCCPELCITDIVLHCPETWMIKTPLFGNFPYSLGCVSESFDVLNSMSGDQGCLQGASYLT